MLGWLPGASLDDIARREKADLNDTRTGSADRQGAWNWQDSFGAWMAGTNKDEVLALAKVKADADLRRSLERRTTANAAGLGPLKGSFTDVDGLSTKAIETQLAQDEARIKQLTAARGIKNFDATSIDPNASTGDILTAARDQVTANDAAAKLEVQEEKERLEDRYDDKYNAEILRQDRKDARADLLRAQERKDSLELRRDNMNLEYARLSQADKYRAQDRKDKAIMMLLQGLGNLGAGFTI